MTLSEHFGRIAAGEERLEPPKALYLHVPLCVSRCAYCDFHSFAKRSLAPELVEAYIRCLPDHLARWRDRLGVEKFSTVYIGGGTPSALEPKDLGYLLKEIAAVLGSDPDEWTIEANPESLNPRFLDIVADSPVTRLSVGIQSMDESDLKLLGRAGSIEDNVRALNEAAKTGLELSADLLAAIPRRTGDTPPPGKMSLADSARICVDIGVTHASIYDLTVEEGTPISKLLANGRLAAREADESSGEREEAEALLQELGLFRYEVSNYALKGHECRHNREYWKLNSYLGVGSGAVSTLNLLRGRLAGDGRGSSAGSLRVEGSRDLRAYIEGFERSAAVESIPRKESAFEMLMMGFRTREGPDGEEFYRRFGCPVEAVIGKTLKEWNPRVQRSDDTGNFVLDSRGMDIMNRFLVDCLTEMETLAL